MVIKKRAFQIDRRSVVEYCFACGALVSRGDRNVVAIFWGDGDPGHDEVVIQWRTSHVRMCWRDRQAMEVNGGMIFRHGELEVQLVLDTTNEMSKTRADGVLPVRGTRRLV